VKDTFGDKIFYVINYIILALVSLSCILPLFHIAAVSLSSNEAVMSGHVFIWPIDFNMNAYTTLFEETSITLAFWNSVVITVGGVLLSMFFTILGAYPLSKTYFFGRKYVMLAIIFTMVFNGGIIPTFLVVKEFGVLNSFAAIWLVNLISAFNLLIMKTFFENIPKELEEASQIDGCSEWRLLTRIYLPLSLPVLATISLFYGISYWNKFSDILFYINDINKQNLVVLVNKLVQSTTMMEEMNQSTSQDDALIPEMIKSASVFILIIPMLVVYPFVQKYFVKGMMVGAVKG